jgi:hypothetical protein
MKQILALGCLFFGLVACSSAPNQSDNSDATGNQNNAIEPSDADLKAFIQAYTGFQALNQDLRPSPQHGGIYVRTYLDQAADVAYKSKSYPFPDGAVAAKEGHTGATGPIERVYMMKKIKGYDPANGDWFYAMMAPDGAPRLKGKVSLCISCHSGAKGKDYVFGFE